MLIGIDVGGTTTDAVLIEYGEVIRKTKVATDHDNLLRCLLLALDEIIQDIPPEEIERVVLSTTLITNLIAEGKTDPVALVLVPGPGMNPNDYRLGDEVWVLKGATDYRGRETQPLEDVEIENVALEIADRGFEKLAVVGKFGQRNHSHEQQITEIISEILPDCQVEMGHQVSGKLNFPRRAATAMLKVATKDRYEVFAAEVAKAISKRKIAAPVYILKADGGTLPLDKSVDSPVETIFSGPAASTMGVLALTPAGQTSVVVDIGGTTTDIALILNGNPLISYDGARVDSFQTHIRAFAVKSVPIGGDSLVKLVDGELQVGPKRAGPAFCLGGSGPTPTDALRYQGLVDIGDSSLAEKAMIDLGCELGSSPEKAAQRVVDAAVEKLAFEINGMFVAWEQEPAYRIWEVLQKETVRPQNVVGVGGGSLGLIPLVAERLKATGIIPPYAEVANAIGAAVARPTLTLTLRIDTEQGVLTVAEDGLTSELEKPKLGLPQAEEMARKMIVQRAERLGIGEYASEAEVTHSEVFNMIRGWSTVGKIMDICMEIPAGLVPEWGGDR